jgi:Ca-activated chloride channel homolog
MFLAGSRLWLLVSLGVLTILYVVFQGRRKAYAVRFTNLALLASVAPRRPRWRRHVAAAAFLLTLASLTVAFARPVRIQHIPRDRATVMVAIDVSLSMEATDVEPTRVDAAKAAATAFVDLLPPRFNVGLVSFASTAQVNVSPSPDHEMTKEAISILQLRTGTAIGEAIFASLDAIRTVPSDPGQEPPPARIVLMSDGETNSGRPNDIAASAAAEAKVPVSTIAFGTPNGAIPYNGREIPVPVNGPALRDIAQSTGGRYFEATTAEQLKAVYADVGSSIGFVALPREIGVWFVGLALVFGLAAAAASLLWFGRLP